ncbi:MAG: valine--tRNA ligase [Solirubrobacterales bacterium]|nr:valine--tRNA ligase [Solirubrobacterales bacterium]
MADRSDLEARTRYDPTEVEPRIVERWLASGLFHPEPGGSPSENYSIAIPLPNVTGVLHMGHALNNSVQDCLIRYHRMRGQRTKWILGTDHAGIATQIQVERAVIAEGSSREQLGREAFVERVWRWRDDYGGQIIEQLKRLGASLDYEDERFTLDDAYARAVQYVFVTLFEKGYIYRDRYMVNWDPGEHSAISDLEVEDREATDTLYYIDYPLDAGSGAITVATVRPETMLADVAIAVHPDDERYARLLGEKAILPLVGRKLKIIADDYVKPEFGTGALKITPGHDPNDFEIGRRHGLPEIGVIGEDGRITDEAPERFRGLTVEQARDAVLAELREQGLIARTEPYTHEVPFSQRSGERIEPLISLQWFMRMDELAQPAIDVVKSGQVRFHPENYTRVYLNWMENIRPWCISRQLWWGHQIPVWYRGSPPTQEQYVGTEPPEGEGWERDPDVLDTWFSSGLFPFAALGWPEDTPALRAFYPTDVLLTGREIVFLWVARMIMLGIEFRGEIPFTDVYVHSIIQAPDGRRMSKSLGTGIDPLDLINGGPRPPVFEGGGDFPPYGADAVRWGMLAMSSAQDVRFSEERLAQGLQLTNKLWNAARLILLGVPSDVRAAPTPAAVEDRWILSRLERARAEINGRIDRFDFAHAVLGLYDFVYGELCDWYLELVKPRLRAGEPELQSTLLYVLTQTLAIAHPMIPFVTEEIYRYIPGTEGLLAAGLPDVPPVAVDERAEASVGRVIEAVQALRGWRDFAGVRAAATVPARLAAEGYEETGEHLARLARVSWAMGPDGAEPVASVPVPGGAVEILPSEDVDLGGAERRLAARRAKLHEEIDRAEGKLANRGFVDKAPAEVVQAERDKLQRLREELDSL